MIKRLVALMLAVTLTMSCIPCGFAEEVASTKPAPEATKVEPTGGDITAAVFSDIVYIPGKAGACVTSGVLWGVVMLITGGTAYRTAADLVKSGCTGKWVLTGEDFTGPKKDN